jgi:hypothetical protein
VKYHLYLIYQAWIKQQPQFVAGMQVKYLYLIYINEMNKPNFNPNTMDIFTKRGREKFDQYMKEKKQWEKQNQPPKAKRTTTSKKKA